MERRKRTFTYEEALALLPKVQELTQAAVREMEGILAVEESEDIDEASVPEELVPEYQRIVAHWAEGILAMGIEVKGLWLIDFDSGAGYYCWQYPEPTLQYFHGYDEGFRARVKLN